MAKFLHAAYAMRIKAKYLEVKDRLPVNQRNSHLENRRSLTTWVPPYVAACYREGIDFATVDIQARLKQDIEKDYTITAKIKDALLIELIGRIEAAEKKYDSRIVELEIIQKAKTKARKAKYKKQPLRPAASMERIWSEYLNTCRATVNNLFVRAGEAGEMSVYKKIKREK